MTPAVASGFTWSVLFLAAVPLVLIAVVGGGIFLAQRRELRDEVERFLATLDHEVAPPPPVGATERGRER